jgi:hypothetical protein
MRRPASGSQDPFFYTPSEFPVEEAENERA